MKMKDVVFVLGIVTKCLMCVAIILEETKICEKADKA